MEDIFDGAWRDRFVDRDPAIEAELARLIDIHGPGLIEQSSQLRQALLRASPGAQRHVAVLLAALSAGVAERLRAADNDPDVPRLLERCVADLQVHGVADAEWAWWAVRTWAHAFALPTAPVPPAPGARPAAGAAPVFSDRAPDDGRPEAAPLVDRAFATRHGDAFARTPVEPVLRDDDAPAMHAAEPPAGDAAASPPAFEPPMFVDAPRDAARGPAAAAGGADAALQVEPLFTDRDLKRLSRDGPVAVPGLVATGPSSPGTAPAPTTRPGPRGRRLLAVALLVGLPLAALVGFFASRWLGTPASSTNASSTLAAGAARADRTVAADPGARARQDTALAPPASGTSTAPAAAAAPAAPDAPSADAAATPPADAPSGAASATTPSAAAASGRPAIAGIEAPRIVAGTPFIVVIEVAGDARDVVAIERRYTDRVGAWPRGGVVDAARGLKRAGNALLVRFGPMQAPAMATVEFTAVSADGARSEPRAATLVVAARAGSDARATVGCTASTCGHVVETREIAPDAALDTPLYAIVVRLDDRERVTYTAPYRPLVGTRVRRTGAGFAPAS